MTETGRTYSILVVDDDPSIRDILIQVLQTRFQVLSAASIGEAERIVKEHRPSLILLDIYLPGENGITLCEKLRNDPKTNDIPLIMMTAMNARETRVNAFGAGADDFLEKPFYMDELFARIESKLRRSQERMNTSVTSLSYFDLKLDLESQKVHIAGIETSVGLTEFKLMSLFVRRSGSLVKRTEVEEAIWGKDRPLTRSLDTHIVALRKHLSVSSLRLRTVYGEGYVLEKKMPSPNAASALS